MLIFFLVFFTLTLIFFALLDRSRSLIGTSNIVGVLIGSIASLFAVIVGRFGVLVLAVVGNSSHKYLSMTS